MDLIKAIAKDQGFTIEINNPGFDAAVSDVQSGHAQGMIAGMTVTDARKETFDFSEPYYTANSILAVQESSKIDSYDDLKGKTVGVKTVLPSQNFLEENQRNMVTRSKRSLTELLCMIVWILVLLRAIMDDEPVIKYAIKQGRKFKTPIEGTPSGQLAFAVKKEKILNWSKCSITVLQTWRKVANTKDSW